MARSSRSPGYSSKVIDICRVGRIHQHSNATSQDWEVPRRSPSRFAPSNSLTEQIDTRQVAAFGRVMLRDETKPHAILSDQKDDGILPGCHLGCERHLRGPH